MGRRSLIAVGDGADLSLVTKKRAWEGIMSATSHTSSKRRWAGAAAAVVAIVAGLGLGSAVLALRREVAA